MKDAMRKGTLVGGVALLLGACLVAGLQRSSGSFERRAPLGVRTAKRVVTAPREDPCALKRAEIEREPALGIPELEAVRGELLARARSEPVLFLSAPTAGALGAEETALRARLFADGASPWTAFADVYEHLRGRPRALRAVLLSDGYLFAAQPGLGVLFSSGVALDHLFREPDLVIERGDKVLHARRDHGTYRWVDGPARGDPARLWLFDRVRVTGEPQRPPLHVSFRALAEELGTTRIEVERATSKGVLARLHYGEVDTRAVLRVEEARAALDCEEVPPGEEARIAAARSTGRRHGRILAELRTRIAEQIDEGLPFDEPKTEEGQQDGKLRPEWRTAYMQRQEKFTFNGDEYSVFDSAGRPRLPQVCVDFVLDTWERMAETRWLRRDEGRGRRVGRLDVSALGMENQRSVEQFIEFARSHPEWFDLLEIPEHDRIPFSNRKRFFRRLVEEPGRFRPGDVVAILGPRDDERLHYHSFFIVDADPLSGMPTVLAANAGRPRQRSWEAELENAPRRGIVARIRPRLAWLETLVGAPDQALLAPDPGKAPPG